jgi:hypothetical protein
MTGCTLSSLLGSGAQAAGQIAAGSAITSANNSAITNQNNTLGNIQNIYSTQQGVGNAAMGTLAQTEGLTGCAPNYSAFMNMPGYQFANQMGVQTAERQAAAMGNAGNSGTAAMIGNQVAGTAMQDYNTYVGQLQASAGLGASANQQLGNLTYSTGANTSQLMSNTGMAQAGEYTGLGQTASSAITGNLGNILGTGANASGTSGGGSASTGCPYGGSYNANTARSGCGLTYGSIGTTTNQSGLSSAPTINESGIQPITGCTNAMLAGTGCYGF